MAQEHVITGADLSPVRMLRALRHEPGLVALFGDWRPDPEHGDALIAFRPVQVLGPDEDPFAALDAHAADEDGPEPPFGVGWIGYLGYQLARRLERLPEAPPRPARLPEHHLARYDHVLRHRPATGDWVVESAPGTDPARLAATVAAVHNALARPGGAEPYRCGAFGADASADEHAAAVTAALRHIRDGDIFQANICRGLAAGFAGDPLDLFCAGHERLVPRFAAFLRLPGGAVASLSPELFLRRTGRDVLTSPIKGTAAATTDPAALHASAKNRAENVMIVDLMRNDLSRACVPGSVRAPAAPRVEPHTGVHHLVADVHGKLPPGLGDGALLRATFPPGSCTGAPKIRAMEIINALEPAGREVYTGAVGCAGPGGLALNVAIRTFEFTGGRVRLGVGGGIVADSEPVDETHETLVKAVPLLDAVGAELDDALRREWTGHAPGNGHATDDAVAPVPEPPASTPVPEPPAATPVPELPASTPVHAEGVFTTLLVHDGSAVDLDAHLRRLGASCRDCYGAGLRHELHDEVVAQAAELTGPHRLRITAVPVPGGGLTVTVASTALPSEPVPPWRLVPVRLPGGLGGHKWADRRVLAHEPAPGLWSRSCDPLLVDADGTVLETGRANVFAVVDGVVLTPPADGRILPGIVREQVLSVLRAAGAEVRERPVQLAELARAQEVFVTNSVAGVHPVGSVDGVGRWEPGPVTARLRRLVHRGATG
ncbi:bifunctional anthranilate synthase component I family protein/aminotransferase class IV [Kocuria sp. M1R5S2]|uniref:bifunctional anthranilate synthase component I family protein/aminotransferase class IV n=1 Tax=Kocuria rhizosphaerae TaxID=3376285 RepID=UPI00378AB64D